MTFITIADAETILGADFAPDGDKARLVLLANTWMKMRLGLYLIQSQKILSLLHVKLLKAFSQARFTAEKNKSLNAKSESRHGRV